MKIVFIFVLLIAHTLTVRYFGYGNFGGPPPPLPPPGPPPPGPPPFGPPPFGPPPFGPPPPGPPPLEEVVTTIIENP
uniref:Uncharacterized protein n=1 Tax=Caenorhabditis japonica TaxID=281687 RepID=A0A8R1EM56_CAEJA